MRALSRFSACLNDRYFTLLDRGLLLLRIGPASEIPIEVELLLELEGLVAGVRLSASFPLCDGEGQSITQQWALVDG